MTVAAAKLPGASGLVQLVFFVVAGLIWVIPAAALITWMSKARKAESLSADFPQPVLSASHSPGDRSTSR